MSRSKFSRTITSTIACFVTVSADAEGQLIKNEIQSATLIGKFEGEELRIEVAKKYEKFSRPIIIISSDIIVNKYEMDIEEFIQLATIVEPKEKDEVKVEIEDEVIVDTVEK